MSERFYDFDVLEAPQAIQEEVYERVKILVVSGFPTDTTVFKNLAEWFPPTVGRVRIELSGSYRTVWDNWETKLTHFESVSDSVRLKDGRLAANTVGGWHVSAEPVPADFFETGGRLKDLTGYPVTPSEMEKITERLMQRDAWMSSSGPEDIVYDLD